MAISRINITQPNITSGSISRSSIAGSGLESVLALNPAAMYDVSVLSSLYQDSAKTTPVTGSGDPVGAIVDLMGNLPDFNQGTSTKRGDYTVSGNTRYIDFDGIDDTYVSATVSGFNFLHDGTGGELFAAVQFGNSSNPNDLYSLVTNVSTTGHSGVAIRYDDRTASGQNDNMWFTIFNSVPTSPIDSNTFLTSVGGTPIVHQYRVDDSYIIDYELYNNGVIETTAAKTSALPSGNASLNMRMGDTNGNTQPLLGRIYALVFFDKRLSSSEATIVNNYLAGLIS